MQTETRPENTIPEVVHVLPDPSAKLHIESQRKAARIILSFGLVGTLGGIAFAVSAPTKLSVLGIPLAYVVPACCLLFVPALVALLRLQRTYLRKWREEIAANPPTPITDSHGRALAMQWSLKGHCPQEKFIRRTIESSRQTDRPRLYVLGTAEMPEVGDRFFEPIVFTPAEANRSSTSTLFTGIAFFALGGLGTLGWLPIPLPPRKLFFQGIIAAIIGLAIMAYYLVARPTYLRFAPGRIQFVRYPMMRRREPIIEDFSIQPGMVAIVRSDVFPLKHLREQLAKRKAFEVTASQLLSVRTTLLLYRDGRWKKVRPLRFGRNANKLLDAFWQATLSTARQPDLGATLEV